MAVSDDTYTNIKSLNNIPTKLSNIGSTFSVICANGYSTEVNGKKSNTVIFTCKNVNNKPVWVPNASQCYKLATLSKCWSASGGRTVSNFFNGTIQTNDVNATIDDSAMGFMDTDCCNANKGLYVDLDLKLKRALCEKETNTYGCKKIAGTNIYSINEEIYNNNWKNRPKQEKLIKFVRLSPQLVDLRCLNLVGLNMSISYPKYIERFSSASTGKALYFSNRPRPKRERSSLNDGSNLKNANFSGGVFKNAITFGSNSYSSGNPGSNLSGAKFIGTIFGWVWFGNNEYSFGNPGSNLSSADFYYATFGINGGITNFGSNGFNSFGNPGSNLKNANFSGAKFNMNISFGTNWGSFGNPGSNLTNADFSNSKFYNYVYFGHNDYDSSGNPGSNLTDAIFDGSYFDTILFKVENTNTCKVKSFDTTELLSKTCSTKVDGDIGDNVYNPYYALNPNDCCIKFKNTGTESKPTWKCESYGWDGTH